MAENAPQDSASQDRARLLELLRARDNPPPRAVANATPANMVGEVARSFGRGVGHVFEFGGDIGDIGLAAVDQFIPGMEDESVLNELNPFSETEGRGDRSRRQMVHENPTVQRHLTGERIARDQPGFAGTALDMTKTGMEWVPQLAAPGMKAKTMLTGALGAGFGEQVGDEVGEVVGGIAGSMGNPLRPAIWTFNKAKDWLMNARGRSEQQAIDFVRDNVDNLDQVMTELSAKSGLNTSPVGPVLPQAIEQGTPAQVAGNAQMFGIEEGAASASQNIRDAQNVARGERTEQIISDVEGQFPAVPAAEQAIPRAVANVAEQQAASTGRLEQATAEAADAERIAAERGRAVATQTPTYEASELMAKTLETAQKVYDERVKQPAWRAFDALRGKNGGIESSIFKDDINKFLANSDISPTIRDDFIKKFAVELEVIENMRDTVRPSEIAYVISRFKQHVANAAQTGTAGPIDKYLTQLGTRIEKSLRQGGAGELYDAAVDATRESTRQFSNRSLGTARRTDTPETFGATFVKPGDAGAAAARDLIEAGDDAIAMTGEYLKSLAAKNELTPEFMNQYDAFLREFPDQQLVGELRAASESQTALTQARAAEATTLTDEAAAMTRLERSTLGRFAEEPIRVMEDILNNPNAPKRLNDLLEVIDNPAAARDAFRKTFINKVSGVSGGDAVMTEAAITEFDKMYPALERIFADAPEQLVELQHIIDRTYVEKIRKTAIGNRVADTVENVEGPLASALTVGAMETLGLGGSHALIMAGQMRNTMMKVLDKFFSTRAAERQAGIEETLQILTSDVPGFIELMSRAPVEKTATKSERINKMIEFALTSAYRTAVGSEEDF